jgi:hypothetical protein
MSRILALGCALLLASLPLAAQMDVPVSSPVSLQLGLGGGVSLPTGDLSDLYNTGWHAGGKVRIGGSIPVNIVGSGFYNSLPEKAVDQSDNQLILGAGLEYPIPSVGVHPYFGADVLYVHTNNEGAGTSSFNRGGLGVGAGVEFTIPAFGSFDTSVKYQFLNIMGKEDGEATASQVAATVAIMIGVL